MSSILKPTVRTFLLIFLPWTVVLAAFVGVAITHQRQVTLEKVRLQESNIITMEKRLFEETLASFVSDVSTLSKLTREELQRRGDSPEAIQRLQKLFLAIAEHRNLYDQIRYIDETGMERVRIDWTPALGARPTPQASLQNKKERPYFIKGMEREGSAYISSFDLNVEQGLVERPFKPVFRITYQVSTETGEKSGLVVMNALGGMLLQQLEDAGINSNGPIYIVNSNGHWLRGPDPTKEWLFVFSNQATSTIGQSYPEEWKRIKTEGSGQFLTDNGLFTFVTIDPGAPQISTKAGEIFVMSEEQWVVLSMVSPAELVPSWWTSLVVSLVVFFMVLAAFSWHLAGMRVRRILATRQMEDSEKQLKSITQTVLDPIVMIDSSARAVFWNQAAENVFGYKAEEVLGRNIHDLVATKPDQEASAKGLKQFAKTGTGPIIGSKREVEALRKNGERFYAELNINAVMIEEEWWAVGVIRDITEKKRAEAELRILNEDLENRVATRTKDLEKAVQANARRERITQLLKEVASTANTADTVAEALETAISLVANHTGWPVGHAYIYYPDEDMLKPSGLWHVTDPERFSSFMDITRQTNYRPGVGLPGRVLVSKKTQWIDDVSLADDHIRAEKLGEITVRAAFGLPVNTGGKVTAVLEFYTDQSEAPDELILKMAEEVGHHLGHVVERKRIEAEVRKLALVAEKTLSGVVISDSQGRVEWINEAFMQISGYALEEMYGKKPGALLQGPKTDPATVKNISEAVHGEKGIKTEILNYDKTGQEFWQEIDIQPIFDEDGQVEKFISIQSDITERKRASEALQQFKSTLDQTHDAVFIFDPDTLRFTYVNQGAMNQVGYTEEEMLGLTPIDIKPEFTKKLFLKTIAPLVSKESNSLSFETVHQHKDGRRIPVDILLQHISHTDTAPRFMAIVRDITEQNRIKRELELARDDAEAATLAKSDFLANMSHEIRTPMNAVIGMSHILLETELSEKQRDQLKKILLAATSLLGVINDILDFSKIEADRLELEASAFNLDDVLDSLSAVLRTKAEEKELDLIFDVDADVPRMLRGDRLRLVQVLTNLGGNAIKFTEEGQVVVKVETVDKNDECSNIRFTVEDTGIGISSEKQEELFEPFMQSDASTTRKYGGTGLGLAICRRLVHLMGGELQVESVPEQGSKFSFVIKLTCQASDCLVYMPLGDLLGTRVLALDHKEAYHPIYDKMLRQYGFEPEFASSWEVAEKMLLKAHEEDPYILLILGLDQPEINGFKLRDDLLADNRLESLKIITITAFPSRFRLEGGDSVPDIVKPFSQSTLFDKILEVLGKGTACRDKGSQGASFHREQLKKLSGLKVLVAEDNALNQEVALELLQAAGIEVTLVGDGARAVEIVIEQQFDAVLMDVQMPFMDGLEATRRIRKRFGAESLPIIAMTAHAMEGDREKSLAAGMNDHMTKPVDPENLYRILDRWLGDGSEPGPGTETGTEIGEAREGPAPWEIDGLDTLGGLNRVAGNRQTYLRLLGLFVSNQAQGMQRIADALDADALEAKGLDDDSLGETLAAIHSLKGVAGNIGALELSEQSAILELALKERQDDVSELFEKTQEQFKRVQDSISMFLAGHKVEDVSRAEPGMLPAEEVEENLNKLAELLGESDADAVAFIDSFVNRIADPEVRQRMSSIQQLVHSFDFDSALKLVREVVRAMREREQ